MSEEEQALIADRLAAGLIADQRDLEKRAAVAAAVRCCRGSGALGLARGGGGDIREACAAAGCPADAAGLARRLVRGSPPT